MCLQIDRKANVTRNFHCIEAEGLLEVRGGTSLVARKDVTWRVVSFSQPVRPVRVTKGPREKQSYSDTTSCDHPHRSIEMKCCLVDVLRDIVLSFEFHQNWLSDCEMCGVEIRSLPLHYIGRWHIQQLVRTSRDTGNLLVSFSIQ